MRSPVAADEPVLSSRLFDGHESLGPDERGVTIPLPLAPPPVTIGDVIELIGLSPGISIGEQQLIDSASLGRARVVAIDDTGITVAIDPSMVHRVVETLAVGTVEIIITPFGS